MNRALGGRLMLAGLSVVAFTRLITATGPRGAIRHNRTSQVFLVSARGGNVEKAETGIPSDIGYRLFSPALPSLTKPDKPQRNCPVLTESLEPDLELNSLSFFVCPVACPCCPLFYAISRYTKFIPYGR